MPSDWDELSNSLSMTEIVRLMDLLSKALTRRFERNLALAFSDIVSSTSYFAMFGDEAGRALQQRHIDLVQQSIAAHGGRIVDTAGDGTFLCFDRADAAAESMIELLDRLWLDNQGRAREHQLAVRVGVHSGPVLTDGALVTGDAVNLCARVAATAAAGEIRVTKDAYLAFEAVDHRLRCSPLPAQSLKGVARAIELFMLHWRDPALFPTHVRIAPNQLLALPDQDVIRVGRLREKDGVPANDIVLACADPEQTQQISRWHFELHRRPDGYRLRQTSAGSTRVDGRALSKGEEAAIRPGTSVAVADVLTLSFIGLDQLRPEAGVTRLGPTKEKW
jgi:class 3 adenylate cyclase